MAVFTGDSINEDYLQENACLFGRRPKKSGRNN